jgi:hypothetical protein
MLPVRFVAYLKLGFELGNSDAHGAYFVKLAPLTGLGRGGPFQGLLGDRLVACSARTQFPERY